jgi:ABC-type Fe2+-enterobactin transport system substrate-binding protein
MADAISRVGGSTPLADTPTVSHVAVRSSASDSVALSQTAQATLLKQQGFTVSEIAEQLGITTTTVLGELKVATTTTEKNVALGAAGGA